MSDFAVRLEVPAAGLGRYTTVCFTAAEGRVQLWDRGSVLFELPPGAARAFQALLEAAIQEAEATAWRQRYEQLPPDA